jgi:predicted glycosyltransferase
VTGPVAAPARVLFHVQHLLGIGHLKRAATLARACERAGLAVTVVSGGHPVAGLDVGAAAFVQLPPVRAVDKYFKILVDERDRVIDDAFRDRRRELLLATFARVRPHAIVTELFPFGRRQLRFELAPLLAAARGAAPAPYIACSVRDILVEPPKPERTAEMLALAREHYDAIFVHGDPALVSFERTFGLAASLASKIRYTGYVVDEAARRAPDGGPGTGEVVVSAGGGAVSEILFRAALAARPHTPLASCVWRLLAGHGLPDAEFDALRSAAPAGVVVERARPDFTRLLANCALSISQGGYNTVMEILATGARAVIVPYAGGLETEQTLRADLLRSTGLEVVAETDLSGERIAAAVVAALAGERPRGVSIAADGAATTARLLAAALANRAAA